MKQWIKLVVFGVVAYIVFAAVMTPVAKLYELAGPVKGLEVGGLQGNLLSGSATSLSYKNYRASALSWEMTPLSLVTGKLGFDLTFLFEGEEMKGHAAASLFGRLYVSEFTGAVSGATVKKLANNKMMRAVDLGGQFQAIVDNIELDGNGSVYNLDAKVRWKDAKVSSSFGSPYLGTLMAAVTANEGDGLMARLTDPGKVLGLKADAKWGRDGKYAVKGTMKAKEELPKEVAAVSGLMGGKPIDGQTAFELNGTAKYQLIREPKTPKADSKTPAANPPAKPKP
jgi:general secretion pathway protein N